MAADGEKRSRPSVDCGDEPVSRESGGGDRPCMRRDLRERIEAGSYTVDPVRVAEAMIGRMTRDRASSMLVSPQALDFDARRVEQPDAGTLLDQA